MQAPDLVLAMHVAVGCLALVLGPLAIRAERRPPYASGVGLAFHWSVLAVSLTALALAALDWPALWWLSLPAAVSYLLALLGVLAPRRRRRGWARAYAHGQGGSYVALVTALLVVSLDGPASTAAWVIPTIAGVPLIEWRVARIARAEAHQPGLGAVDGLRPSTDGQETRRRRRPPDRLRRAG